MAIFKKALAVAMSCCLLLSAAACAGGSSSSQNHPSSETPSLPSQETPSEDPETGYGEKQADPYDENYTEELLALGEQAFTYSQLSGTDAYLLHERTPNSGNKAGKYVGIFYFLWQNEGNGLYDISDLLEKYGPYDTVKNPLWALPGSEYYDETVSPMYAFHYFEEPLYGYYASTDKWVVMKHLELLTYAGIDFLYLDFTNANTSDVYTQPRNIYPEATYVLLESILELQKRGVTCPRIVPVCCNPGTGSDKARSNVVEWVYNHYYMFDEFKYKPCWFTADETINPSGKPLFVTYDIDIEYFRNKNAYNAFWFRKVVWPTQVSSSSYDGGFPWMDYELPQANYSGFMNVSVAQHTGGNWSSSAFLAQAEKRTTYLYRGRGARGEQKYAAETDSVEEAILGHNFSEQWENALAATGEREPSIVTVTGWNEWTAQKLAPMPNAAHSDFVDTFSIAFSRDVEMMRDKNGYSDNFYMMLSSYTAKFKAKPSTRHSDAAMWKRQTIDISNFFSWEWVRAKYLDLAGNISKRNQYSVGKVYHYTDDSARNDIDYLKIANDSEYLYILVSTREDITAYRAGDDCWMNLYLSTKPAAGWQGYNFVVNRSPDGKTTSIERLSENHEGQIITELLEERADYAVEGKNIAYRIPLKALGIDSGNEIGVKACDNIFGAKRTEQNDGVGVYTFGDVEAFYCGGDCAPAGRLNYAYRMAY